MIGVFHKGALAFCVACDDKERAARFVRDIAHALSRSFGDDWEPDTLARMLRCAGFRINPSGSSFTRVDV